MTHRDVEMYSITLMTLHERLVMPNVSPSECVLRMASRTHKEGREKDQEKTRNKEVKHWVQFDGFLLEKFPPDGWVWRVSKEETVTFFLKLSCDSTG